MQRILIAGEGGQGVQLAAEILAKSVFEEGKKASYIPNFGVEQRGGVSLAFVIIDDEPIIYPKFYEADVLVIMIERARERTKTYLTPKTKIIDATKLNFKDLPLKTYNMFILGNLIKLTQAASIETVMGVLEEKIGSKFAKDPRLREDNLRALKMGCQQL